VNYQLVKWKTTIRRREREHNSKEGLLFQLREREAYRSRKRIQRYFIYRGK